MSRRFPAALAALATLGVAAPTAASASSRSAVAGRALAAAKAHRSSTELGANQALHAKDVIADRSGATHTRFTRTYRGLSVLGGDVVVHRSGAGAWRGASLTLDRSLALSTAPSVSEKKADATAVAVAERTLRTKGHVGRSTLVVDAREGAPRLAWAVTTVGTRRDGTPSRRLTTIDAKTGRVLGTEEQVETATGTGRSLYDGTVPLQTTLSGGSYVLTDATRGGDNTVDAQNKSDTCIVIWCFRARTVPFTDADDVYGDGTTANRQSAASDVHYGVAETWDYYKATHGRNGIGNDGKGSQSRVHYGNKYNNAFWDDSCFCMTYGDGDGTTFGPLVALDVTGHEMSHGVTSRTANLTYSGESGGLNESTSDIFGTLVEFYANNANDTPDYTIGERISKTGSPLRWMDKPSKDGNSADCWSSTVGNKDVHYSSGVGNHFFYLLAVGSGSSQYGNSPTCNGSTVAGIGNDAAGKIWYRALTVYMTSSTDYHGARTASLNAARDLYGAGSAQYNAVNAAWAGVGVS